MAKKYSRTSFANALIVCILLFTIFVVFFSEVKYNSMCEGFYNNKGKELVLVHMHGCPHCVSLMPEWEKASRENNTNIKMRAVEMTEGDGPELSKKHNIKGFPTILFLNNGEKVSDYNGKRNKIGILNFLQKKDAM